MTNLSLPVLAAAFVCFAVVIWVAGVQLSKQTEVLDARLHLGSAVGGLVLLALATNLPELAITAAAAASNDIGVATGNILGGIAIQTVVLAVIDLLGARQPLTYLAGSLISVLEACVVIAVLAIVIAGSQLPSSFALWRLTPAPVLIAVIWVVGLLLVKRAGHALPWKLVGAANETPTTDTLQHRHDKQRSTSTLRAATAFSAAAGATLVAGVALERSGALIAAHVRLSGVLFGATVLAAATSLPELSTGLASVRNRDYRLAVSDIFGGNAFLPVLFLLAALLSGQPVLPQAHNSDIYLTSVAMLVTMVYAVGLLFRSPRQIARMGIDSVVVIGLYGVALCGLAAVAQS